MTTAETWKALMQVSRRLTDAQTEAALIDHPTYDQVFDIIEKAKKDILHIRHNLSHPDPEEQKQ